MFSIEQRYLNSESWSTENMAPKQFSRCPGANYELKCRGDDGYSGKYVVLREVILNSMRSHKNDDTVVYEINGESPS